MFEYEKGVKNVYLQFTKGDKLHDDYYSDLNT